MSEARITGTTDPEDTGALPTDVKPAPAAPAKVETPKEEPKAEVKEEPAEGVVELKTPVETPAEPAWAQRRINKAVAERESAIRRVQELEIQVAALAKPAAKAGEEETQGKAPSPVAPTPADLDRQVQERAAQIAFQKDVDKVYQEGLKQFPDFAKVVQDLNEKALMNNFVVETVMDFEDPAKVFMALGQDLNESSRIFSIGNARKQVQELTRFAMALEAPKTKAQRTKAPEPIEPKIAGATRTEPELESDTVSTADWIRLRDKQVKDRRAAGDKRIR